MKWNTKLNKILKSDKHGNNKIDDLYTLAFKVMPQSEAQKIICDYIKELQNQGFTSALALYLKNREATTK